MPRVSRERLAGTPALSMVVRSRRRESSRRRIRRSRSRRRRRSRPSCVRSRSRSRSRHASSSDRSRSHSRSRHGRTRSRRSRSRTSAYRRPRERPRSVISNHHRESSSNRHDNSINHTLDSIMSRLTAIEDNTASGSHDRSSIRGNTPPPATEGFSATKTLADALAVLTKHKPSHYYVSNFDPNVNNFEVWSTEVERAKLVNHWDDRECFSRVAHCLKGDAKTWLNEWNTDDRSWSNFVRQFKSLCPQKVNFAQILHEVINSTSDKFLSYAEYARRSLLRLRVIKGLSEELMVQIVVHGISDVQVRAAATNADLTTENLVSFLATYTKPTRKSDSRSSDKPTTTSNSTGSAFSKKRNFNNNSSMVKCFNCGQRGHLKDKCPKKQSNADTTNATSIRPVCTFCKKPGHKESDCFAKARSEGRSGNNQRKVNLCRELVDGKRNNDISTAVIQGIPVDILIDSGALNVSLISSAVVNNFSGSRRQINCSLKGIGDKEFVAREYITLTVEFNNISLEVDFIIVPASYMNTPIIIGTDVLNRDGVTFIRTKDEQYLTHTSGKVGNVNAVTSETMNTPLIGADLVKLMTVVEEFSSFLISGTATTTVNTSKMHINLTSDVPVVYHPYRLSYQEKLKVREICQDLLDKKIIRESNSEYASPVILVKKKDGSDRMCVDFRALNRVTVKDRYPLPLIDDHIDRLGGSKFFTSLDMASGFHQIPIDEGSIHKTGFVTAEAHYEYLKMPYGLCNAPTVYQRIINNTLRKFIEAGSVLVYIDDVLILSMTVDEGISILRDVLKTLTEAGFSINVRKCTFLATEVEYLGRVISHGHVRPSPSKVEALVNSPTPTNVKQVRQFLGLAGYFRRYIAGYATKTAGISRLLKKDVKFEWGSEQDQIRKNLIEKLTSEPILAIFDPTLPTELHTDASSAGYGAVLMQTHADGGKRVVAYYSKVTQGAEPRYHSYELETLAVVKALQHFRHYLIGVSFKIVTDCNALKATERKKDLLPRVARWWIYLQDFDFVIEYRKGVLMSHADYLSRNPPTSQVNNIVERPLNWAQIAQSADSETVDLVQKLRDGELDSSRYVCQNDVLYYRYTPVGEESRLLCYIPKGHRLSLLRVFHDEHEHIGADKTYDLILKHFWFPGLKQFVRKYTAHCLVCISKKRVPRAPYQPISSWEKSDVPFDTVHVDALGPLPESNGYKFVFVLVDSFTKFCLLYPMYRQDTSELKRVFGNAISLFGTPKLIVCDRGRMFESTAFKSWVSEMSCDVHYITPEMHHSNGQAERYVRTVLNLIRVESNKSAIWSDCLCKIQLVLNVTKQKTTQYSALYLLIGTNATTPVIRALIRDVAVETSSPNREARRELSRSNATASLVRNRVDQDTRVNSRRHPPKKFQINDLVFVIKHSQSVGKLDSGMRGPYRVTKVLPSDRYEMKLLSGARGKTTQAAATFMVLWKGEWCPESCSAFFDSKLCLNIFDVMSGYSTPSDVRASGRPSVHPVCRGEVPVRSSGDW